MASPAVLAIRIVADAKDAAKGMAETSTAASKMAKAGVVASAGLAALAAGAVAAGKSASDLDQAYGALESVFGASAGQMEALAAAAAKSTGLAAADYANMAATIGAQLGNMGVDQSKLSGTTDSLIKMGADLAATFGGPTSDAVAALSSLLRGEADPIERYGVGINQATIQAELARKGLDKLTGTAAKQAKTQVILELVTKQTAKAQGQFAREADGAAGAQAIATAEWENASAQLGQVLLPYMAQLAQILGTVATFLRENATVVQIVAGVLGVLAVAVLAVNAAMKVWAATTQIMAAVQWVLNSALLANPITWIVLGIVALIAVLVIAWQKSDTFRRVITAAFQAIVAVIRVVIDWLRVKLAGAWQVIKTVASAVISVVAAYLRIWYTIISTVIRIVSTGLVAAFQLLQRVAVPVIRALTTAFDAVKSVVAWIWDKIKALINLISQIHLPSLPDWLPGIGGRAVTVAAAPAVGARAGGAVRAVGGSGFAGGVTVNVLGSPDPQGTARAVQRLLANADVRTGRRRLA